MPPQRAQAPPPQPSSPATTANPDQSNITISTTQSDADPARYQFYGTTFTLHRVSRLFLGLQLHKVDSTPTLSESRLRTLAQRLRDVLVGDVVRGVEVGLGATESSDIDSRNSMGRMGSLEAVVMKRLDAGDLLDVNLERLQEQRSEDDDGGGGGEDVAVLWASLKGRLEGKQGLAIELVYENSVCVALLLPDLSSQSSSSTANRHRGPFLRLPLMLMRMPTALKAVVTEFLAAEFDCKVSPSRIGTRTMVGGLERWIGTIGMNKMEQKKDMLVALGFNVSPMLPKKKLDEGQEAGGGNGGHKEKPGLATIDVIIPWQDLSHFVKAGQEIEQDEIERRYEEGGVGYGAKLKEQREALTGRLAGRLREEGWEWRDKGQQPFTEALAEYTNNIMALKLFHPAVRVVKVACSGFVMAEGKLKIFETMDRAAVVDLLGVMCEKAMVQDTE
ncbi:kinetochore complex Sim4 subunit Fta1-domain-containing protein [Triangularia setosa]|uniref:Kinetochore complex Sim4 subunit Fta1-domain-containing protein n=1 Tax=Triangularia setosa TaxID=2587417 RepID=A0AAN6WEN6_9PEZI|nr:kinetochore complex Sim4 subunit Fta1-domain-containing protein [Podospora setosa]